MFPISAVGPVRGLSVSGTLLLAAEALGELVGAEVEHGGAAVGAGLGRLAGLELVDEVAHLLRRQGLTGAHGGVAGQRGGDAQARVGRRVFARQQVQQLDEGAGGSSRRRPAGAARSR